MTLFSNEIIMLASDLIEACKQKGIMIATAESCTGGLIAAALTEITGSSAVVDRGFVTYSNEAKLKMLGVKSLTLDQFGAVSKEVAIEMVRGAVRRSNANLAVSVTGIAGPGGGSLEKPVGLVHIAVKFGRKTLHEEHLFGSLTRSEIRMEAVRAALILSARITS
ncbi:MAG: CinA family protein [Rhizobiaceae bacterium]